MVKPDSGNPEGDCILSPGNRKKIVSDPEGFKPFRCLCGSLLARLVSEGVELKCRRCKRHIIVPLAEETSPAKTETI